MRKILAFVTLLVFAFVTYLYFTDRNIKILFSPPCSQPITYMIGDISPRYELEEATLKKLLTEIDQAWSASAEKNLFAYGETEDALKVNILYEEQQQFLDDARSVSTRIEYKRTSYESAKREVEVLEEQYTENQQAYNELLRAFDQLRQEPGSSQREQRALSDQIERERLRLNRQADRLNKKVERANRISREINEMIADYNATYGTTGEFNQGDYQKDSDGERINIYGYRDLTELKLVLAHEMGHALGLGHVQNSESIMYYLMRDQPTGRLSFSKQDTAALNAICGN